MIGIVQLRCYEWTYFVNKKDKKLMRKDKASAN